MRKSQCTKRNDPHTCDRDARPLNHIIAGFFPLHLFDHWRSPFLQQGTRTTMALMRCANKISGTHTHTQTENICVQNTLVDKWDVSKNTSPICTYAPWRFSRIARRELMSCRTSHVVHHNQHTLNIPNAPPLSREPPEPLRRTDAVFTYTYNMCLHVCVCTDN